jgi:AraC-like DNA-binding protein
MSLLGYTAAHGPTSRLADLAKYRAQLTQLAQEREYARADADRAMQGITNLLPSAIQAGISMVDAAQLTGLSRPTLYRMLSESRERRPLRDVATQFEQALELNQGALPYDLADHLGTSPEQVFEALVELYPLLAEGLGALGPTALTSLIELLPELGVPERIVLPMLLLQGKATDYVAASTQLSANEVLGWAALGLLRLLPRIRRAQEQQAERRSTAAHVGQRYRVGDPRRHRRFDL